MSSGFHFAAIPSPGQGFSREELLASLREQHRIPVDAVGSIEVETGHVLADVAFLLQTLERSGQSGFASRQGVEHTPEGAGLQVSQASVPAFGARLAVPGGVGVAAKDGYDGVGAVGAPPPRHAIQVPLDRFEEGKGWIEESSEIRRIAGGDVAPGVLGLGYTEVTLATSLGDRLLAEVTEDHRAAAACRGLCVSYHHVQLVAERFVMRSGLGIGIVASPLAQPAMWHHGHAFLPGSV